MADVEGRAMSADTEVGTGSGGVYLQAFSCWVGPMLVAVFPRTHRQAASTLHFRLSRDHGRLDRRCIYYCELLQNSDPNVSPHSSKSKSQQTTCQDITLGIPRNRTSANISIFAFRPSLVHQPGFGGLWTQRRLLTKYCVCMSYQR